MTTPIVNAVVTAYPTTLGFPTLSGQTNDSGEAVLPLSNQTSYNFQFTQGAMGAVLNVFPPANHTFTLYRLKNVTASTVPISVYPFFKFLNTEVGISRGTSQFALPGSYPVSIPAGRGANFKSFRPGSLFRDPTARSTTFTMPARDTSISIQSRTPATSIYLIDGTSKASTYTGLNQLYIGAPNSWKVKSPDLVERASLGAGAVAGRIYAACGFGPGLSKSVTTSYDPATNAWASKAPAIKKQYHVGYSILGGSLYLVGGSLGTNQAYTASINKWTLKTGLPSPTARDSPVAGVLNSKLYTVGGLSITHLVYLAINQAFDPKTSTWSAKASDLNKRGQAARAVIGNTLYVIDGFGSVRFSANNAYTASANSWKHKTPDPTPRSYGAGGVIGSSVFVIDGLTSTGITTLNHVYDPTTDTWSDRANNPTPTAAAAGTQV
jgi:hypothetical protein